MMKTDHAPDRAQSIDCATSIAPQQPAAALDSSGSAPRVYWSDSRRASALRRLSMLCLAILCTAAGGSSPNATLIVAPRVELGPLQGLASNLGLTPVSGLIVDLNGDGAPDIVVGIDGGAPAVYLNNGTSNPFQGVPGVFVSPPPGPNSSGTSWGAPVVADVNADGHPDLAIAGFNAPNMIYLNNGTADPFNGVSGIAVGTQDIAYVAALGDVNGDGFPDMAVANSNHVPSRLYLTNGAPLTSGNYSTIQIGTDLGYGQDVQIADVNGDGKPDLILTYIVAGTSTTDPSGIAIYLNNGTSNPFNNVTPLRLLVGQSVGAIAVADLNGDGKPDLVAVVSNSSLTQNDLNVYLNTGSASAPFSNPQTLQPDSDLGGGCLSVNVGDVNGDGLPDLLFGCTPPSPNASPAPANPAVGAIYLNNGTANPFANVAPVDIPATPQSGYARGVAVGTLVKNGAPDVLIVDMDLITGGQSGAAAYDSTKVDQDPIAQNDTAVVAINKSIQVNVLVNDTASSGQTLNVSSVTITTAPGHGTATVDSANGSITYQPSSGYSGTDSFQYTVRDNLGAQSNTASVSVRIQPAPVATNDTATLQANQSVTINILANDTSSGGTLNPASINIVVSPTHGTAIVVNGEVQYTPTMGYSGLDTFQYSVQDNLGTTSNVATVSIEVTPPPSGGGGGGSVSLLDIAALVGFAWMGSRSRLSAGRRRR
jgi:Bacterial Ig domain/FG-GAP-like repeat/FG-GAP repeat